MYSILVVDDNDLERKGITFLLNKKDATYEIVEAADGVDALEKFKEKQFHLLITDIKMPYMDGVELAKKVRSFDQEIAIIILSGYEEFSYAKELLRYKILDYLLKPLNPESLYETINQVENTSREDADKNISIQKVIKIIETEYQDNLNLHDLSQRVFLSTSYLSNLFKQETGVPLTKYVLNIRMLKASELLKNSQMKVAHIASRVGIENVSYFNKIFKEYYGITPTEYRSRFYVC